MVIWRDKYHCFFRRMILFCQPKHIVVKNARVIDYGTKKKERSMDEG